MSKTYWEKLKDPRWQKKRLEVMEAADFTCQMCGAKDATLNVHHGYYKPKTDPWDYNDGTLWCLCEICHEKAEDMKIEVHKTIGRVNPKHFGLLNTLIDDVSLHIDLDDDDRPFSSLPHFYKEVSKLLIDIISHWLTQESQLTEFLRKEKTCGSSS